MDLALIIGAVLPSDYRFQTIHLQSHPKQCKPLVLSLHSHTGLTLRSTHFIMLSRVAELVVPLYGIEVNVYFQICPSTGSVVKTVFVSKADTTGLDQIRTVNVSLVTETILRYLVNTDVLSYFSHGIVVRDGRLTKVQRLRLGREASLPNEAVVRDVAFLQSINPGLLSLIRHYRETRQWPAWTFEHPELQPRTLVVPLPALLEALCPDASVTLSLERTEIALFTKAADQYLFPGSFRNASKHCLTGDQLLRWWVRLIDSVAATCFQSLGLECTLLLPGAEARAMEKYFPSPRWSVGSIYHAPPSTAAVFAVPLFPDDPKGRFLEHLVVESRAQLVSLEAFWAELSIRQEFRLGDTVGVIGVRGTLSTTHSRKFHFVGWKQCRRLRLALAGLDYSDGTAVSVLLQAYGDRSLKWVMEHEGTQKSASAKRAPATLTSVHNLTSMVRKKPKPNGNK